MRNRASDAPRLGFGSRFGATTMVGFALAAAGVAESAVAAPPDGRAWEQVSDVRKSGQEAGGYVGSPSYSVATPDGSGVLFMASGPLPGSTGGGQKHFVARRTPSGWRTEEATPPPEQFNLNAHANLNGAIPSTDLRRMAFWTGDSWGGGAPKGVDPAADKLGTAITRTGPGNEVTWLSRPQIANPVGTPGELSASYAFEIAGGARDLSSVYFGYTGTLVEEDAPRVPNVGTHLGYYRFIDGRLESAGLLPDGTVDPEGARPASLLSGSPNFAQASPDHFGNQISADGRRALFVSPDPYAGSSRTTQLYMRRTGEQTRLVTRSEIDGQPSTNGPIRLRHPTSFAWAGSYDTAGWASADGKRVYFSSIDQLTADAPNDGSSKGYLYDVDADDLTYLPGVNGVVVAGSDDGSSFLFVNEARSEIGVWRSGQATKVADLGAPPSGDFIVAPARSTTNGSVFVFQTNAPIPGFDNPNGWEQIYRYDAASAKLVCVSCRPDGQPSSNDAHMTNSTARAFSDFTGAFASGKLVGTRGITSDGSRVYFDTVDPLVPQDVNGRRDVYEWRADGVRLLSSGSGPAAFFMDNSESGNDVFIATTDALSPADTDGGFDVYDARVGGGFPKDDGPAPCSDNCQGPGTPQPQPNTPSSSSFSGPGNESPAEPPVTKPVGKVRLSSLRARGTTVTLRVVAPAKGRISVTGPRLRGSSRTVSKPGTYSVKVRLTAKAVRSLRRNKRVAVRARVGFRSDTGAASSAVRTVTVKR